jgi:hypothetical protein
MGPIGFGGGIAPSMPTKMQLYSATYKYGFLMEYVFVFPISLL